MIHIVFVDDDLSMLAAMRRALHGMRSEWNMDFVASGAAALESLSRTPADVIVSDMRMPGMDGWQLLAAVKDLYPQTVRFVLSGHADTGSIMRSVGTAHQYLAKPCDSASLKAAIQATQQLRRLLTSDRLATLVGRVGMLPSAPQAFQQLLACLRQPDSSLLEVARIIESDVAMTANIMKLVNSAFFGLRQPINSVERAVSYLGLDTVGALMLGQGVFRGAAMNPAIGFTHEQLWQHSLLTAVAARAIAQQQNFSDAGIEEAFLASVLHDVGKVIFATAKAGANAAPVAIADIQRDMRDHHAEVGAYLLGLWGFPTPIVEAVAYHHTPGIAPGAGFSLAGVVHVADYLAHQETAPGVPLQIGLDTGYLESCGLADRLPQWAATLTGLNREQTPS